MPHAGVTRGSGQWLKRSRLELWAGLKPGLTELLGSGTAELGNGRVALQGAETAGRSEGAWQKLSSASRPKDTRRCGGVSSRAEGAELEY